MGTTSRCKYRIECRTNDTASVNSGMRGVMVLGTNTKPKNLQEWCENQEKSEMEGKPNHACALARGFLLAIHSARLIRQSDDEIVADYKAAPFRAM